jgi:hypothetical protein
MPPFVRPRKNRKKNQRKSDLENYEVSLLVIAKRVGLSFDELNQMTLDEFFDYVDIWVGDNDDKSAAPRQATQADIDAFFRM